ncbi:hypothetical protein LUZ63_016606 [Rhynchospora breviuscula]|uniref:NB-ARC domain-containing protein n=1 Tax=Rhynchospora breviuscula TaxID=2022672 RepID=A0A9P9ZA85_9POAL|nr:hypothetical protein LUZ63_016606 [Rhynchospora breviuscula]
MEENLTDNGTIAVTSLPVVAITGRPGIGKTTLAKYVYGYARKEGLFDIFMWVYVPRKFKASDVMQKMLKVKQTKEESHILIRCCVLRNVYSSWTILGVKQDLFRREKFTSCLSSWGSGSKILITTHSPEAAKQINVPEGNIHELAELEEDPFFELFMHHAFDNDSNVREDILEEVGRKIAKKLKGDPKAAEVVGAQLRKKRSKIEWQKLSERDWSEDEIMELIKDLELSELRCRSSTMLCILQLVPKRL